MTYKIIVSLLLFALHLSIVFSQEQGEVEPTLYVDSTGQVFTRTDAPAYIFISPADSEGELVLTPSSDRAANPMEWDGNGTHYIVHRDLERNMDIRFRILADGTPPKSNLQFDSGLIFHVNHNYFAEVNSQAYISATDDMTGVKQSFVSMNYEPFRPLEKPISFPSEGEFSLRVYSVDNVGNAEEPIEFKVITSPDAVVQLDNIYFDLNSANLRPEARKELNKLASIMGDYPEIHLEIMAHTDSRGNATYNLSLSEQRAQAAVRYLESRGVPPKRLKASGFGETKLLNECKEGVECPEELHEANRRVEFIVTRMDK